MADVGRKLRIVEYTIIAMGREITLNQKSKEYLGLILDELAKSVRYRHLFHRATKEISPDFGPGLTIFKSAAGQEYLHLRDLDSDRMEVMKVSGRIVKFLKTVPSKLSTSSESPARVALR